MWRVTENRNLKNKSNILKLMMRILKFVNNYQKVINKLITNIIYIKNFFFSL